MERFVREGSTPATRGRVGSTRFWAEGEQKPPSLLGFLREGRRGRGADRVGPASWSDSGGPGARGCLALGRSGQG